MHLSDISIIILYLHILMAGVDTVNITAHKYVSYCTVSEIIYSSTIFNGVLGDVEIFEKQCEGPAVLIINMRDIYDIHYVVVYEGEPTSSKRKHSDQLDYFRIDMGNISETSRCSEYPRTSLGANTKMRVNCEIIEYPIQYVFLKSRVNKGLYVSEIEVHNLGHDVPDVNILIYRGCFKNFNGYEIKTDSSFDSCQTDCSSYKYSLAALKNNRCYCGNQYDPSDRLSDVTCNLTCGSSWNSCGGYEAFSVYIVLLQLPNYVGCFKPFTNNSNLKVSYAMTISNCLRNCDNSFYAAVQNGDKCVCLNNKVEIPSKNDNYLKCKSSCSGDKNEICGSTDYVSVYETCLRINYHLMKCTELFNCAGEIDMFGRCVGACKPGFHGQHCLHNDGKNEDFMLTSTAATATTTLTTTTLTTTTQTTTIHTTTTPTTTIPITTTPTTTTPTTATPTTTTSTTTIPTTTTPTTTTPTTTTTSATTTDAIVSQTENVEIPKMREFTNLSGTKFQSSLFLETITKTISETNNVPIQSITNVIMSDITTTEEDLCLISNPCTNISNSVCVTFKKEVLCDCIAGYFTRFKSNVCKDIDECDTKPCHHPSTVCINSEGSYVCDCREGFVRGNDEICLREDKSILQKLEIEALENSNSFIFWRYLFGFLICCIAAGTVIFICKRAPSSVGVI